VKGSVSLSSSQILAKLIELKSGRDGRCMWHEWKEFKLFRRFNQKTWVGEPVEVFKVMRENSIKIHLCDGVDWIHVAQGGGSTVGLS
jgi:hypothetical protein